MSTAAAEVPLRAHQQGTLPTCPVEHATSNLAFPLPVASIASPLALSFSAGKIEPSNIVRPTLVYSTSTLALQTPPSPHPTPHPTTSSWSFMQGFLIGQLSVIIMICAFIKYFIFGESTSSSTHHLHRQRASASRKANQLRKKKSSVLRNPPPLTTATILSKTYYNVNSHQPESLDWFNVLIAQTIAQFRDDARQDDAMVNSLDEVLNGPHKPDFLDRIKVTEVSLGEDFPIFSNCRISPSVDEPGKLQARMDIDLSDVVTLGVESKLLLNYPKPLVAVLPVGLAVSVVRFSGTLSISFIPALENTSNSTTLTFSLLDDYRLDLSIRSLVGSRSRLQDVPKIAQIIESRIHSWIDERCVEPKFQQIVLPSLWPRKRTTREHAADGDSEGGPSRPTSSNLNTNPNPNGEGRGMRVGVNETIGQSEIAQTDGLRRRPPLAPTTPGAFLNPQYDEM